MKHAIPESINELGDIPQWVVWRLETRKGKTTKVPYSTKGGPASTTDSSTWATLDAAQRAAELGKYDGIGFVFSSGDPYCGIDFDHCIGPDGLDPEVAKWLDGLNSYTELSPSGTGLHCIVRAELAKGRKNARVEMYDRARYFTMTFKPLRDRPIADAQDTVDTLIALQFPAPVDPVTRPAPELLLLDDGDLMDRISRSSSGPEVERLMAGRGVDDASGADLSLCNHLAFWTRGNADQMDRIFRRSALMRPKWDSPRGDSTYGADTIQKAISGCTAFYDPNHGHGPELKLSGKATVPTVPNGKDPEPVSDISTEAPSYGDEEIRLTDLGNARRLVAIHGDQIRYCTPWGKWLYWDGIRWREDDNERILRLARDVPAGLHAEARRASDEKGKAIHKWALASESARKLKDMAYLAQSENGIGVQPEQMDANPYLLNTLSGTVDLVTGVLCGHERSDYITRLAPVPYDPAAQCPAWIKFLHEVTCDDEDLVAFLQRAAGYSLTASISERAIFVLYGSGKNGKSTFVETLSYVLGDYSRNTPAETLMVRRSGGDTRNDVARLVNVRMVTASESEQGHRLAESLVKQLTGGDQVTCRFLHREFFSFTPVFKLWLSTNHRPEIRGTDDGIWDRVRLIPWRARFDGPAQDKNLAAKLRAEGAGILAWAVRGCLEWQEAGLGYPAPVQEATEDYRSDMDVLGDFLSECCGRSPNYQVAFSRLYNVYRTWCEQSGERPSSAKAFRVQLSERGLGSSRDSTSRYVTGVDITHDPSPRWGNGSW